MEIKKQKTIGDAFEDEVWTVFYKMGFTILNKSHQFNLSYGEGTCTKQIDVIAIDDDCNRSVIDPSRYIFIKDEPEIESIIGKGTTVIIKIPKKEIE